jgi:hypothetical protein
MDEPLVIEITDSSEGAGGDAALAEAHADAAEVTLDHVEEHAEEVAAAVEEAEAAADIAVMAAAESTNDTAVILARLDDIAIRLSVIEQTSMVAAVASVAEVAEDSAEESAEPMAEEIETVPEVADEDTYPESSHWFFRPLKKRSN